MNARQLQALIAINAARIASMQFMADDHKSQAAYDLSNGDDGFATEELAEARKLLTGKAMRKANELQRELKAELKGIHREARIDRKLATLQTLGVSIPFTTLESMTTYEIEAAADRMLAALVLPKPDTRAAA